MAEQKELIGYVDCAHCGEEVALKGSKKGKAYYNCPNCGQMFFRTAAADAAVRAKARSTKKGEVKKDVEMEPVRNEGSGGDKPARGKKDDWDW